MTTLSDSLIHNSHKGTPGKPFSKLFQVALRSILVLAVVLFSFVTGDAALAGRVHVQDAARAYVQDAGRSYVQDAGRSYVQDAGRAYVQDAGRAYVQDAKGSLVAVPELDTVVIDDEVAHLL